MSKILENLKQRKLDRMRLGQATCTYANFLSDPEVRIALVPLTEAEYINSLEEAEKVMAEENAVGAAKREAFQREVILRHACRESEDLSVKAFDNIGEIQELDSHDVNHLWDEYLEMTYQISPSLDGLTDKEFEMLKKVWETIEWSELTGPQWYAAKRFLASIQNLLPPANSLGSSSTNQSMKTKTEKTPASIVSPNKTKEPVSSADNH